MIKFKIIFIYKSSIILLLIIILNILYKTDNEFSISKIIKQKNYENNDFIIIQYNCYTCGLFSIYKVNLGCIKKFLIDGYVPIIDVTNYPNILNKFGKTKENNWELFFEQPFGYRLEDVVKNAKHIKYTNNILQCGKFPDQRTLPLKSAEQFFWHHFANRYMPVKSKIIDLANHIMYRLFKTTKNILGVLIRGTDYVLTKPSGHPIQPNVTDVINDVKEMDNKYKYDYIFFTTEDEIIRKKFSKIFQNKVKQIRSNIEINYDYSIKRFIAYNNKIKDYIEYNKLYLLNIIIMSRCLDIVTVRCNGAVGIFILTNGFRNIKMYNLGLYP